jgi:threonine synthase
MHFWEYNDRFEPKIDKEYQLDVKVGNTPLKNASFNFLDKVFLKREDLNPTNSHKDRSLLYQISAHLQDGERDFVISSSGNSAISAINIFKKVENTTLTIFLSTKLSLIKQSRLEKQLGHRIENTEEGYVNKYEKGKFKVIFTKRAVSSAFRHTKDENKVFLRGSTDPYALEGFKTLAYEIYSNNSGITDIFIPTSSGTTLLGVYEGYRDLKKNGDIQTIPRLHTCQTPKVKTIAREFVEDYEKYSSNESVADSIVDRVAKRKMEVVDAVEKSEGSGWIVTDEEIGTSVEQLSHVIDKTPSPEAGLALASLKQALKKNYFDKVTRFLPTLIISGVGKNER